MPTPGLSLVGFMDQAQAINHLLGVCIPTSPAIPSLIAEWTAAVAKRGPPIANAGNPDIQPIPADGQAYLAQLHQEKWVADSLAMTPGATFQMVEIDPLLAYQFTVDNSRSSYHCGKLNPMPPLGDLLMVCLPTAFPNEQINVTQQPSAVMLKTKSLNVRIVQQGFFQAENKLGIQFGMSLPFVHVVRFNGRCYLHNGFHRIVGVRKKGATHVPCLFRDVSTSQEAGIRDDGATFPLQLLQSADPPTLAHFTQGRAYDVTLKAMTRIVHVTWHEYGIPDE
ncbi:MAG TPA: hypothetical protein VEK55_06830 [Xanthobacteraceae bacterium]|nr:hypothetical protein [Xanthobacteraceae bacterium]